jgi:hypothetical protein
LGKKFERTHLNKKKKKKLGMLVSACHPSYTGGINRATTVQASLDPSEK